MSLVQLITRLVSGKNVVSDMVLFAAGRQGATDQLSIENAALVADKRGRLVVNVKLISSFSLAYL